MNPFELHPEFYDQPIHLTPEEMSDPRQALRDIFFSTALWEMRQYLWKMVEACIGTPDPGAFETNEQRENLLLAYYDLERALDAAALLAARRKEGKTAAPAAAAKKTP
ncbi:MAG: hypothetical protein ABW019_02500 [Chitinophagaceae bacterium]